MSKYLKLQKNDDDSSTYSSKRSKKNGNNNLSLLSSTLAPPPVLRPKRYNLQSWAVVLVRAHLCLYD